MKNFKKLSQNKKLIILDFDGVIAKLPVDWPSCREEFKIFLKKELGLEINENKRVDEMESILVEKFGQSTLTKSFEIRKKFEFIDFSKTKINQELLTYLTDLKKQGIIVTILSNNLHKTIEEILKLNNLNDLFDIIIGIDDSLNPKPSPKGARIILDRFNLAPKDCLFVGDSPSVDGETAKNLAMDYVNLNPFK